MNASTPERCPEILPGGMQYERCTLSRGHITEHHVTAANETWPVRAHDEFYERVEEPAGEQKYARWCGDDRPHEAHAWSDMHCFGVAQSANADVRDVATLVKADIEERIGRGVAEYGERLTIGNGRDALRDAYEEALDLALYLRQELGERALPPPVGDETEALREDEAHQRHIWESRCPVLLAERDEALARVVGLEAREAALRDALREARRRRPPRMSIEAFERMIDAALADSGEAGS